jgi:hypothetical protein
MNRRTLPLTLVLSLTASTAPSLGSDYLSLSGGAHLTGDQTTTASSPGWSNCLERNETFLPWTDCGGFTNFYGQHFISDVQSYIRISDTNWNRTYQYSQTVSGNMSEGRCYRATLRANATRPGYPSASPFEAGSEQVCGPDPAPPDDDDIQCETGTCSPVLIDLDNNGFHLSSKAEAVSFDLDGDGQAEAWTWTLADSQDAFLVLDRNGNGVIDSGKEMFGGNTVLSTGELARKGYIALAEFDLPSLGGNFDGFIGPEDAVFPLLRLWVDTNHNGESESSELLALSPTGLLRLAYDDKLSWRRDGNGNLFRYKSKAWRTNTSGNERVINTYDVFLRRAP